VRRDPSPGGVTYFFYLDARDVPDAPQGAVLTVHIDVALNTPEADIMAIIETLAGDVRSHMIVGGELPPNRLLGDPQARP